jgi:FSR family fosmidomycin resistance protein-like MFS transporter
MPVGLLASIILYFKLRDVSALHRNGNTNGKISAAATLRKLAPIFICIFGFQFFRAAMKSALTLYLPTYLTMNGESLWFAGISLSVLQFAGAAGIFGTGYIADKISHKTTLMITALFSPFVMWAFIYAEAWLALPLLVVMGLLLFASGPVMLALVQKTNTARPAFVNSIYMTINFGISSVMVLAVGFSGDMLGLLLTYKISAGLAILAVPFVVFMPKKSG